MLQAGFSGRLFGVPAAGWVLFWRSKKEQKIILLKIHINDAKFKL